MRSGGAAGDPPFSVCEAAAAAGDKCPAFARPHRGQSGGCFLPGMQLARPRRSVSFPFSSLSRRPGGAGLEAEGTRLWSAGPDTPAMTSSPVSRVVYNGKRNSSPRSPPSSSEIFTPAHEENVRFIYEAWQGVERDLRSQMSGSERGLVEEYVEKVPNPSLKTFKPIDLSDLKRRNTPDAKKS
ncbi:mapk-regulated corepressor-interacting protein 1 isoform X1 [Mustela putorius furo]|uniref:Mapk-regulated corepressor-interacting protein 1 isoform X1 n=2 Tax=Mustela TaxID=9665 RepID=A0A8U0SU09_MUSPF|nr:mapk-regulated corepressor-interacting protein 1 isoform X1 [Mustela putorius furo]